VSRTILVIPLYNDTERLEPFLKDLARILPPHFSILVSDDGSTAIQQKRLHQIIDRYAPESAKGGPTILPPGIVSVNSGKGAAVRRGWDYGEAHGFMFLAFADADGAVSAKELAHAEQHIRNNHQQIDALFGSRVKMLGRSVTRSLKRHLSGRIFATLVSLLGNLPAYDTQCGLKILKAESYRGIQSLLQTPGFAFDVELCFLLQKSGCRVSEFPVDWHDVPGSKVSLLRDPLRMAFEVAKISRRVKSAGIS
jgi:dolichyl-phosphate beta-glucosyltransferase